MKTAIKHTPRQSSGQQDTSQQSQSVQYTQHQPQATLYAPQEPQAMLFMPPQHHHAMQGVPQQRNAMEYTTQHLPNQHETQCHIALRTESQYQQAASSSYMTPVATYRNDIVDHDASLLQPTLPLAGSLDLAAQTFSPSEMTSDIPDMRWTEDVHGFDQYGIQQTDFSSDSLLFATYHGS